MYIIRVFRLRGPRCVRRASVFVSAARLCLWAPRCGCRLVLPPNPWIIGPELLHTFSVLKGYIYRPSISSAKGQVTAILTL